MAKAYHSAKTKQCHTEKQRASTCPAVVGMLHVPINTAIAGSIRWREAIGFQRLDRSDIGIIRSFPAVPMWGTDSHGNRPFQKTEDSECCRLSFYRSMEERMLAETEILLDAGIGSLMLENVAAPYFVRREQPPVIYWVMRALAERLRSEHPNAVIGIQILAYSDDWAMDIACRCRFDFIRCESALFEGVRPEGRTPNTGNLAKLYMTRNMLMAQLGTDGTGPQVYVDVQKKHTVFMPGLDSLDVWLENTLFQKLEGVIITGRATGCPVEETDLRQAREAIEKAKADSLAAVGMACSAHWDKGSIALPCDSPILMPSSVLARLYLSSGRRTTPKERNSASKPFPEMASVRPGRQHAHALTVLVRPEESNQRSLREELADSPLLTRRKPLSLD